ncbi:hypothetical protein ZEAMMB73_Zm00001d042795 [Zea mays]|uniref:Uncharacterized protein n=1 Tax=Zea mays TaxID=4577 RepID=C0PH75_MAIZE|nr:unknown [Zea mays]ONM36309.1 hypothetical protein ZEAMMB73_Zm00001d042795 [Zea mays]ONM36310.1 hypothetical protein ZEAMMB73_Zm00001d042795 [Zea mays]ONM36314.1 hypothetical protein ZEAMMB73_Zm00001d042795 [Zea mays]
MPAVDVSSLAPILLNLGAAPAPVLDGKETSPGHKSHCSRAISAIPATSSGMPHAAIPLAHRVSRAQISYFYAPTQHRPSHHGARNPSVATNHCCPTWHPDCGCIHLGASPTTLHHHRRSSSPPRCRPEYHRHRHRACR